jgi:hypothetical protein
VGFPIGADGDPTKTVFLMFYTEDLCGIGVGFQSGADSQPVARRELLPLAANYDRRADGIDGGTFSKSAGVAEIAGGTDGSRTLRWRGMDSNFQFRAR